MSAAVESAEAIEDSVHLLRRKALGVGSPDVAVEEDKGRPNILVYNERLRSAMKGWDKIGRGQGLDRDQWAEARGGGGGGEWGSATLVISQLREEESENGAVLMRG